MQEKKEFCRKIYSYFKNKNMKGMKKLNDQILKMAVIQFSKELFDLAVYSYILSKIISKPRFLSEEYREWLESIEIDLLTLPDSLEESKKEWNSSIQRLKKSILNLEKNDSRYVMNLIKKGEIKSAATLYAQGLSLGLASKIVGIEQQELLNYAGKTMMFDRISEEKDIFERVKNAKKMFGV
ncbi:MAG: hypothetical protein WC501_03345 [Candidatus Micrarchaeia archaeon]